MPSLISTAGDPLEPPLLAGFRGSPGFGGGVEPVCAAGSPTRPPVSPGDRVLLQPPQGIPRGKGECEQLKVFLFF